MPDTLKTPYTFDRVVRIVIGLAVLTLLFLLIRRLGGVLTPFFVGWLLAYLLHPIVSFFQYTLKLKSRVLSIVVTLLLSAGIITGSVFLLIPPIAAEIKNLSVLLQNFTLNFTFDSILPISWQNLLVNYISEIDVVELLKNPDAIDIVKKVIPQVWDILGNSMTFIISTVALIIVVLYLIFILKDYENINNGWPAIIPPKYRGIVKEIAGDIELNMNRYFRGQALIALIVGILFSIGFVIIDLPMAILFGIFVGILNLVPYLQTVAIVPGFFLILLKAAEPGGSLGSAVLGVLIVFALVQGFQDMFLVPKIMGKVTGMRPAVILLSLSIWGSLMGIIGMIIALPMTTLMFSYYNRWVIRDSYLATTPAENTTTNPELNSEIVDNTLQH
ncbi:MAG: AI-2E family transporter [Paludibacter sp.]|jgi:predicted PurR-regulated permease PerM|nr:AI-2E family transporter [Paludibacter sp.]